MTGIEAFSRAIAEIGDTSADKLASLMEQKYGVRVEPQFIPFLRVSQQESVHRARLRQALRTAKKKARTGPNAVDNYQA